MILILAFGNSLRRDDGSGPALGEYLHRIWSARGIDCRLVLAHQLFPEHAEEIARPDVNAVVFCDAEDGGNDLVSILRMARILPSAESIPGAHYVPPQAVLAAARTLYQASPPAWAATVPGTDFRHGEGFSEAVSRLLRAADAFAADLLTDILSITGNHTPASSVG
jgi:hydrogenase maturation protease